MSPHLGTRNVGLDIADHLLARLDQESYPEHVAHRPAHTEQAGLMTEKPCHALLQLDRSGILGVHVIAERRGRHGLQHLLGWLGHGVRAQIDHGQESEGFRWPARRVRNDATASEHTSAHGRGPATRGWLPVCAWTRSRRRC